jgi:hypothetical protein
VLPHLGLSFNAKCELRRAGFARGVYVTASLRKELLRILMRAGEDYCQREDLHNAWDITGKPIPNQKGRLDTEISRLLMARGLGDVKIEMQRGGKLV